MRYDVFVSVVIPLVDDGDIVEDVVHDVAGVLKENYQNYELILVDDGSCDNTKQVVNMLKEEVDDLRYFRFARKFGLEVAIACGLDNAIGDVVVVIRPECDPVHLIPEFVDQAQSCRGIVVGTRNLFETRSWYYKLAYDAYYWICTHLLERPQIYCSTHFIALTRTALNSVLKIKNSYRYLRVISMYAGYRVITHEYKQIQRRKPQRYRKLSTIVENCASMIVSNSLRPLRQAGALAVLSGFFNLGVPRLHPLRPLLLQEGSARLGGLVVPEHDDVRAHLPSPRGHLRVPQPCPGRGEDTPPLLHRGRTKEQRHDSERQCAERRVLRGPC